MGKDKKKSRSRSKSGKKKEKKEKKEKKSKAKKDSIKKESIKKKESLKKESQKKNKKQKESKKKDNKSRKKSQSPSPMNAQKKQAQDEQKLKEGEQKRLSRLMKAKLIKFQNSDDDDDDDKKEFVYKDPEVIEPILPPDEQLIYDWSQRNQEKQIQDALKKCRLVGEKLFYDSDGIEEDDNPDEQFQDENCTDNKQDAKMQEEYDQEMQKQNEKVDKEQQQRFLIEKKTLNNDSDSDSEDEVASNAKLFTKNLLSISKLFFYFILKQEIRTLFSFIKCHFHKTQSKKFLQKLNNFNNYGNYNFFCCCSQYMST